MIHIARRPEHEAALLDAAMTVQRWQRMPGVKRWGYGTRRYIANRFGVANAWDAIEAEIVRRELEEDAMEIRWAA